MGFITNRIEKEFIFKFIIVNNVSFEIKINKKIIYANLIEQNPKELKITFQYSQDVELIIENKLITLSFFFQNNYHSFDSKILKIQGNSAIINNPPNIIKNIQRKYDRVILKKKLPVNFMVHGDLVKLSFPETVVSYYPNTPPIDADFYDINIEQIMKKFDQKMSTLVSHNKIRMLRSYLATTYEEQIVIKHGKVLFIPDTHTDLPQKQLFTQFQILTKTEWVYFEMLKNKTQAYLVNKHLSNYLSSLSQNGLFSQAIFPVLYRNYVVALIYLINDYKASLPISEKIMNYTHQFTRVLSYILKENNYFKEEEVNTKQYNSSIFDLSPGGLALEQDDNYYEDKLLLNHNARLIIQVDDQNLKILAKLVRKFKKKNKYYYGFMFIDIKKKDFDFLNNYLYNE